MNQFINRVVNLFNKQSIKLLVQTIRNIISSFDLWLFKDCNLYSLGLFRVILSLILLSMYIPRHFMLEELYGKDSLIGLDKSLMLIPEYYRPSFHWFFWSENYLNFSHLLLILFLFLMLLGIGGRFVILVCWLLNIAFLHRNWSVVFGADLMGSIWLFYLIFTNSTYKLSILNYFKTDRMNLKPDQLSNVFFRLMQIQICAIYTYTGLEKLKGTTWWDGTALWNVFRNTQIVIADFSFMRHVAILIPILCYITILFEIYFMVFVWGRHKKYLMTIGILFHVGIAVLMELYQFSGIMLATYLFFINLNEAHFKRCLDLCLMSRRVDR